jgi:hypothetical protein
VALKRRDLDELLSEELRRLDPDEVYAATVKRMARTGSRAAPKRSAAKAAKKTTEKTTKSTAKKAAKKPRPRKKQTA